MENLIHEEKALLITGDFNLCNNKKPNNAIKSFFGNKGFNLLVEEATQIMGGFIDQAYWRDSMNYFHSPKFERYSPYFSDHDALCITLKEKVITN